MKENFNIDELFKQKFDNFQADVDPGVWANIQAGLGAGATGAAVGGISAAVKVGLISGGIIAASVATWYFGFYEPAVETAQNNAQQTVVSQPVQDPALANDELIIATQKNESTTYEIPTDVRSDVQSESNNNVNQATGTVNNSTSTNTVINATNPVNTNTTQVTADSGVNNQGQSTNTSTTIMNNGTVEKPITETETIIDEVQPETPEAEAKSKASIDKVPNSFTPDGDQINDLFFVESTEIESFFIVIRDKNGKEVFKTTDKDFVWDGTDYSGEKVEKGTYSYVIFAEGKDGVIIQRPGRIYVQ